MELLTKFTELETKQKLTIIVTAIIAVFAIYLAYDTFFGGTAATPPAKPVATSPVITKTPVRKVNTLVPEEVNPSNAAMAQNNAIPAPQQKEATPAQLAALAQSQQMQQQYINLVNAYQMAQIEQKLAAADNQIAESKLSTAKAMVSTQEYAAKLPRNGLAVGTGDTEAAAPQTVYVGQQAGKWLAMLSINGSYVQVSVGTRLPDGSVVTSISDRGVILDNNGEPSYLPMAKTLQ